MRIGTVALLASLAAGALALPARGQGGWVDEAKLGLLAHDVPLGSDHKENGPDINAELLFRSPNFLAPIFAPRPHIGVTANTLGLASYAYAGLTWSGSPWAGTPGPLGGVFASLGLGGAIHNGPNNTTTPGRLGLGTRLLFHEYVELGYRLTSHVYLAAYLDHVSNADTGRHNPGLTNLGLRLGYRF